ncbi:MAG: hypothetical protein AB2L14_06130 [Candidatus Xenobiia bacterium LiM19]
MKKPSLQFSVPCLAVTEDDKGPPSFNRIFYELPFPEFPFRFPKPGFFIANGWCNGQGNFVQSMKVLTPEKKTLIETGNQPFELKEIETPFMAINLFQDIPFEKPGTYWIQIFLDGEIAVEYAMVVRLAEGAQKSPPREAQASEAQKAPPAAAPKAPPAAAEKAAPPKPPAKTGTGKPKTLSAIDDMGNIAPPRKKP